MPKLPKLIFFKGAGLTKDPSVAHYSKGYREDEYILHESHFSDFEPLSFGDFVNGFDLDKFGDFYNKNHLGNQEKIRIILRAHGGVNESKQDKREWGHISPDNKECISFTRFINNIFNVCTEQKIEIFVFSCYSGSFHEANLPPNVKLTTFISNYNYLSLRDTCFYGVKNIFDIFQKSGFSSFDALLPIAALSGKDSFSSPIISFTNKNGKKNTLSLSHDILSSHKNLAKELFVKIVQHPFTPLYLNDEEVDLIEIAKKAMQNYRPSDTLSTEAFQALKDDKEKEFSLQHFKNFYIGYDAKKFDYSYAINWSYSKIFGDIKDFYKSFKELTKKQDTTKQLAHDFNELMSFLKSSYRYKTLIDFFVEVTDEITDAEDFFNYFTIYFPNDGEFNHSDLQEEIDEKITNFNLLMQAKIDYSLLSERGKSLWSCFKDFIVDRETGIISIWNAALARNACEYLTLKDEYENNSNLEIIGDYDYFTA